MKLELIEPGLPGQPMYYVVPAKAANADAAKKFVAFATSPEIQAEGIVKRFNWYPGIDAEHVQPKLDAATWSKLFTDVKPEDLASKGKPFPLTPTSTTSLRPMSTVTNSTRPVSSHAPAKSLRRGGACAHSQSSGSRRWRSSRRHC